MSANRKRSYPYGADAQTTSKQRMVGGRVLTYIPRAPVLGSSRARALAGAPAMGRTGGYSFRSVGGRELNFKDTSLTGISFDSTPVLTLLNGIAPGTSASQRVGRRINMKSLEWRFNCSTSTTTTWSSNRFMFILDTQANAATPAFTDIYDQATPSTLRNISNMPRFKVLYDSDEWVMVGNNDTDATCDLIARAFKGYMRFNLPVQYNAGTAGTIGDIQTNALYFVTIGNASSSLTNTDIFNSQIRIRYDDN